MLKQIAFQRENQDPLFPDNLNSVWVECTDDIFCRDLQDNSVTDPGAKVNVYFRDLEQHLIHHIEKAGVVLGCVAWLTSQPILEALAKKDNVSIVVQKEDFLRPDSHGTSSGKKDLHQQYTKLKSELCRHHFDNAAYNLSVCRDPSIDPVRCVGNLNSGMAPAHPRMHNKFMIFCKAITSDAGSKSIVPYGVWTGSFNFTWNAGRSLENAVYIEDPIAVQAYFQEFGQILAISEPLDWESEWARPDWRLGT